jgi:sec-independent protein translocase protein TatB
MFDISWTEFVLIGVVALVVIGPKELPAVMRTMGQWTRKVRGMAADFQNQFQEAMREAEMADLKKQVDDMAHDIKNYDPLKDVRSDVEAAGKDIERSLTSTPESTPLPAAEPAAVEAASEPPAALSPPDAPPAVEAAAPTATVPVERSELEVAGAEAPKPESAPPAVEAAAPTLPVERSELEVAGAEPAKPESAPPAVASDNTGHAE